MSQFLITTMSMAGHVNPGLPIARALVARGHTVGWYTGRRFQTTVEATGARFFPLHAAVDGDGAFNGRAEGRPAGRGVDRFTAGIKHGFVDPMPILVDELRRITAAFPVDVVLTDLLFVGAMALHELGGPPWASFGVSVLTRSSRDTAPVTTALPPATSPLGHVRQRFLNLLFERVIFADVTKHANRLRATLGLPALNGNIIDMLSPYLYLQSSTPAFEYPRRDLPPQLHWIGPLLPAASGAALPAWWDELGGGRPVVLVTQGTVANAAPELIAPALEGLGGEEVLVVATTGGAPATWVGLDPLPANARVAAHVPYAALMPQVDVMVTNGGYGGVQFALAHGIPLVVADTSEDKAEIAARVAWSGAGINLKTAAPTAAQVRGAVREVLTNARYRTQARRIAADYARHDAPGEAAALLEQLAATGQPVLRNVGAPAGMQAGNATAAA